MLSLYGRLFRTIYPMSSRESKEGALRITYPETESYTEALQLANIPSLKRTGRDDLCIKYMDKMKSKDHPLHFLLPRPLFNQPQYNLKKNADRFYWFIESITGRTKRADNFSTFRYFN